jgi:hypothetical protein
MSRRWECAFFNHRERIENVNEGIDWQTTAHATYRSAGNRQNDLRPDRSRLTMKLNDSRNAKFPRWRLLRYRIALGDRVPFAVRDHLASRVMAVDNGLPTCEDNARIYRFYRVADARAITLAACWWIYNLFAHAARRPLRELMAYRRTRKRKR